MYCNRTLNLRAIKVIGYDMDYTLVHYNVDDWERRAYDQIKAGLLADGWPVEDVEFDPELVMRGLVVDTELGNVLKANRFGYVKTAAHGTQRLSHADLRKAYTRTIVDLRDSRFRFMNTLFALSECTMFAQLVDRLDGGALHEPMSYRELYRGVQEKVDAAHTEGELKADIMRDPDRYVHLDEETVLTLLDQKHAGKRLVLITNSEWAYTAAMMKHSFDPFLPDGMTWRSLFEVTIVAARKPAFFEAGAPLLRVVNDDGLLEPQIGALEPHGCYFGGNAGVLERHLGVSRDEILYLGDHMYGDVRVTKNVLRWRTGLILRELEAEIAAVEAARGQQASLARLMQEKQKLEHAHAQLRLAGQRKKVAYGPAVPESSEGLNKRSAKLRQAITALDEKIAPLAAAAGSAVNARWGMLMRAGNDKSQLARQIERYSDFYTSRVSNLLNATPFAYLRSVRGSLPHDP